MGQQQVLLIMLTVVVVGVAVIVGLTLFKAYSVDANLDAVVIDVTNIAAVSQQYYLKPTSLGGGGSSFVGWTIPLDIESNSNGTYTSTVEPNSITFTGIGKVLDPDDKVCMVVVIVTASNIGTPALSRVSP